MRRKRKGVSRSIRPGRDMNWKTFFRQLYEESTDDGILDMAAALTFWSVLALFPFLVSVVTLVGLLLDPGKIDQLVVQLAPFTPVEATRILTQRLQQLQQQSGGGVLTVSFLGAIWAASGGVSSLTAALNRAYNVRETRPLWKTRGTAVLVTLGAGLVCLIALLITFGVPALGALVGGWFGGAIAWFRFVVSGFLMMLVWGTLYWVLPNVKPTRFQIISPGSVVGVILWLVASWGFTEYARRVHTFGPTYGALASAIVLLVWMWLSCLVIVLGAEINKVLTPKERLERSPAGEARLPPKEPGAARPGGRGSPRRPEPEPA